MKKKRDSFKWYRSMRTTNEARANDKWYDYEERNTFCRAKRNKRNLPNAYDDYRSCHQKTWKVKRETQYRTGKRGKRHEVFIPAPKRWYMSDYWVLKEYCEEHDIPYEIEEVTESYTFRREIKEWKRLGKVPNFVYWWKYIPDAEGKIKYCRLVRHMAGYKERGEWVGTGKFKTHIGTRLIGHKVVWWADKDIGIEYIYHGRK